MKSLEDISVPFKLRENNLGNSTRHDEILIPLLEISPFDYYLNNVELDKIQPVGN